MAKSLDVAVDLLNKSIERAKTDSSYYMDFVKLHKLMYLGQCCMEFACGKSLFEENIIASDDGPYIEGLDSIIPNFGFGEIKNKIDDKLKYILNCYPISMLREDTCNFILDNFGRYSTDEIVEIVKSTFAYQILYNKGQNIVIPRMAIAETGRRLFDYENKGEIFKSRELSVKKLCKD